MRTLSEGVGCHREEELLGILVGSSLRVPNVERKDRVRGSLLVLLTVLPIYNC
jgi:hypothetical protein